MENKSQPITVQTTVHAPVEKVWELWSSPAHISNWNNASEDWYTPSADNDLREGGRFVYKMAAKDGSFSFDFGGTYDKVAQLQLISYILDDGRKVAVKFSGHAKETEITETFEPEQTNPIDMQKAGWQAILDNFKKYAEANQQAL